MDPEEKINPFKSNSSLNSNSVHSNSLKPKEHEANIQNLEHKLENVEINESEEKWYRELGLYDTQNIQRIQTLDLRNNKVVTEDAQKIIEPILEKDSGQPKIREKVSNNSGGSFYSSESGPTGSGGSTGDQKIMSLSPKGNNFQNMDERFEESIRSEERELMKKRHQRELDDQRRRQEYEEKMEEEGRLRRDFSYQRKINETNHVNRIDAIERMEEAITRAHRMELEAKEAEQRARRNREKYDGQMQRIEQELKLEEAKLAQVRDQRVQAEQKLKQRYNYNQDYSVIHPGQKASKIHDVPDIPSPNLRSLHNTNNKSNNNPTHNQPRYYFQENKIKSREPPQYQERNNNHDNNSGSVENILNDPSLQATLL